MKKISCRKSWFVRFANKSISCRFIFFLRSRSLVETLKVLHASCKANAWKRLLPISHKRQSSGPLSTQSNRDQSVSWPDDKPEICNWIKAISPFHLPKKTKFAAVRGDYRDTNATSRRTGRRWRQLQSLLTQWADRVGVSVFVTIRIFLIRSKAEYFQRVSNKSLIMFCMKNMTTGQNLCSCIENLGGEYWITRTNIRHVFNSGPWIRHLN